VWTLGTLRAGSSVALQLEVGTLPTMQGEIVNTANATSGTASAGDSETTTIVTAGMPTPETTPTPTPTLPLVRGRIQVRVWTDLDRDGQNDAFEPPLGGALLELFNAETAESAERNGAGSVAGAAPLASCVTGATGACTFENLAPGLYRVVETNPAGRPSTTADEVLVEVLAGQTSQAAFGDAGYWLHLPLLLRSANPAMLPW